MLLFSLGLTHIEFVMFLSSAKPLTADGEVKVTKKKGKELKVLDPKSGQNLCEYKVLLTRKVYR